MTDNGRKILLAMDDRFLLSLYQSKLGTAGYEVVVAMNGEEALDRFESDHHHVVLLDTGTRIDSFAILKRIRKSKSVKSQVPVVILTNFGHESDVDKGLLLGANEYIVKATSTLNEVIGKINTLIR
jgi:DNA-binding response OmpR family regulator